MPCRQRASRPLDAAVRIPSVVGPAPIDTGSKKSPFSNVGCKAQAAARAETIGRLRNDAQTTGWSSSRRASAHRASGRARCPSPTAASLGRTEPFRQVSCVALKTSPVVRNLQLEGSRAAPSSPIQSPAGFLLHSADRPDPRHHRSARRHRRRVPPGITGRADTHVRATANSSAAGIRPGVLRNSTKSAV